MHQQPSMEKPSHDDLLISNLHLIITFSSLPLAAVCEGNWENVAQKLVITTERETRLSPLIKSRQHTDALAKKAWVQMQEDLVAPGPRGPGHAVTALPWSLGAGIKPVMRHSISLLLWIFDMVFFIENLSCFPTDTAVGKTVGLLEMPLGMSAESCGNYELFLLQATSKDHAEDDGGWFLVFPHCFLSFVLTAGICMLPFFYQKILLVPGVCRPQIAAGGLKQAFMSCGAGCPLLGPCAGASRACQLKVAQIGLLWLLHPKVICWLTVVPVLNLGLGENQTPALLPSWEQIPTTCIDPGHCFPKEPPCRTMLKLVGMFSVGRGLSLHSQVACSRGEGVACRLPARSFSHTALHRKLRKCHQ